MQIFRFIKYQGGDRIAVICFTIMTCLTDLAISHGDTTLYSDLVRRLYLYLILLLLVVILLSSFGKPLSFQNRIWVPIIFYLFYTFDSYAGVNVSGLFDAGYSCLRLSFLLALTNYGLVSVFRLYRRFMVFMAACGIVIYFAYILSIPLPHTIDAYYSEYSYATYVNYGVGFLFSEFGALRLCGLFNEPGAFGTFLGLLLCCDNLDLRKKENIILFVAGVLTFSMAFFAIVTLAFLFKIRAKKALVFPLAIVIFIVFFFKDNLAASNPIFQLFLERFSDGFAGIDNRSNFELDSVYSVFFKSSNSLFGYGRGFLSKNIDNMGFCTYKTPIIEYGIIGFLLIYGSLLFAAFKESQKNPVAIGLIFCFAASIYQRPNVFTLGYFVILFGGILYILENQKQSIDAKGRINTKS